MDVVVVDMEPKHVEPLAAAFPIPDYCVSEAAIRDAMRRRYPFNVIKPITGGRVDTVLLPRDRFAEEVFRRGRRVAYDL